MSPPNQPSRRRFLKQSATVGGALLTGMPAILCAQRAPSIIASDASRPMAPWGLQLGDVLANHAIVWSRADKPARMLVEWALAETFKDARHVRGLHALLDPSDYTARVDLTDLPADRDVFVRVVFEDLDSGKARSEPVLGRLRTAPRHRRDVRFVWGGDTNGQAGASTSISGG